MLRWPKNAAALGEPRAASWKRGGIIEHSVVELRDVFPTMLDAIGKLNGPGSVVPKGYKMDGDSLLCLLGGGGCRGGKWRPYLDLEHYQVYNGKIPTSDTFSICVLSVSLTPKASPFQRRCTGTPCTTAR